MTLTWANDANGNTPTFLLSHDVFTGLPVSNNGTLGITYSAALG